MKFSTSLLALIPFAASSVSYDDAMSYLSSNLPSYDIINKASLGFGNDDTIDGLNDGVASVGTNSSLTIRDTYPWAGEDVVPDEIYLE